MAIKRKKRNGRIYLEEYKSVRINGEIKSIYVRSLCPEKPVTPLKPKPKTFDRLEHGQSYRSGAVTLLWKIASELGCIEIINEICCENPNTEGPSPGNLLTAWAINRVIDPLSNTILENWILTTDLPKLMKLNPSDLTRESFLSAMDFVCYEDKTAKVFHDFTHQIDDAFYQRKRKMYPLKPGETETVAYDLTSVLFFGITCPLAELGYNPEHIQQLQVNLALLVSKHDKCPISHFIYNGSRNGLSTVKNLVAQLINTGIKPGTIIWDRGNVSKDNINDQNEVLAFIGEELNELSEKGKDWSEAQLHEAIDKIVGSWKQYVFTRVKRNNVVPRIEWNYIAQQIEESERSHGKYLLYSTDESIPPREVVKSYFEKDFVEKVFRTLKTSEEMEPVRHRLENRVRVYIFVCVMAYRLRAELQWRLDNLSDRKGVWRDADAFIYDIERVERVVVRLGHQVKNLHLNLTGMSTKTLEMIGFKGLFKETVEVDFKM
jgi:transposase